MNTRNQTELQKRILPIVLIGFALSSCTPASLPQTETRVPTAAVMSTAVVQVVTPIPTPSIITPTAARVVIRVGTGDSGDALNPHQMIIQSYEDNHSNVMVQMEAIAGIDYYARLMTLAEAKRAPDVVAVADDYVQFFVEKGMFLPLDDLKDKVAFDPSAYVPGTLEPGQVNGKQYFLPHNYSPLALYYNKKLFDAAGLPYPEENWTWDNLLSVARRLTIDKNRDGKPEQWGIQMNANWETGFEYWVAAAGGKLISEDGKNILGYMDSPESIRALQFYADMYNKYKVTPPPYDLMAWGGGNQEFENGTAAMLIFGHWPHTGFIRNPNIDLGVTAPPRDKIRANILFWDGYGVSSSSENPVQAADFLAFYGGEGSSEIWGEDLLPVVKTAVIGDGQILGQLEKVWLDELDHLVPRAYLFTPYWEESARFILKDALTTVIMDPNADVTQTLKKAARESQAALDLYP